MVPFAAKSFFTLCNRSLRSVAGALKIVVEDDQMLPLAGAPRDNSGLQVRFFPNRKLLIAIRNQLIPGDLNAAAERLTEQALAVLSTPARQDCRFALVCWAGDDGTAPAAAVDLTMSDEPTAVGVSWKPRHLWLRPVPDPDMSPESALDEAIQLVRTEVNRALSDRKHECNDVNGALRLCEACFVWANGIAPADVNSFPKNPKHWPTWLEDFLRSAGAEETRLFPKGRAVTASAVVSAPSGKLAGTRVFLSYAMPDNVELAMPIKRALQSHGASVWFDQTERPDESNLDQGLQNIIANQNVFLLCASPELFENAGYALQELAWVLDLQENGSWTGVICVAVFGEVLLPTALQDAAWIDLSHINSDSWPDAVVKMIELSRTSPKHSPAVECPRSFPPPSSDQELSIGALLLRTRHAATYWDVNRSAMMNAIAGQSSEIIHLPEFEKLKGIMRDLDWNGALASYDSWPPDPMVRDIRLRWGTLKCLFYLRALKLARGDVHQLGEDMKFLAERRLPLLDEPSVPGWDDEERRFAVRCHLGFLRQLAHIIRRGLAPGLKYDEQCDQWERSIALRQRECMDGLLELRRQGRVQWYKSRAILWDRAYHELNEFLYHGANQWTEPIPWWIQIALGGARMDASALFADVVWRASRGAGSAMRHLTVLSTYGQVRMEISAHLGVAAFITPDGTDSHFALDVDLGQDGRAQITLLWAEARGQKIAYGKVTSAHQLLLAG